MYLIDYMNVFVFLGIYRFSGRGIQCFLLLPRVPGGSQLSSLCMCTCIINDTGISSLLNDEYNYKPLSMYIYNHTFVGHRRNALLNKASKVLSQPRL